MNKIILTTLAATTYLNASAPFDQYIHGWRSQASQEYAFNHYVPSSWAESFETKIGTIEHNYTNVTIKGINHGWLTARCIAISLSNFDGVPLKEQLCLSVQMTREQFINALKKADVYVEPKSM